MNILQYALGKIRIKVFTADIAKVLAILSESEIYTEDITVSDDISIEITIYRFSLQKIKIILGAYCQDISVIKTLGVYPLVRKIFSRPIIVLGVCIVFVFTIYLQGRILFVEVIGNSRIPSKLITECAVEDGICIGASRKSIHSEKVKNTLLQKIPQLQWVGVTTKGCLATISVKEKDLIEQEEKLTPGISSIIADRDGVIQEITVTEGTALCQVGQEVTAGQTLVSGYTECEKFIKGTHAKGEVVAETRRNMIVIAMAEGYKRGELLRVEHKTYLQFGKKLINLRNNSSISYAGCVRICNKKIITLPGGYQLPAAVIQETIFYYAVIPHRHNDPTGFLWVDDYSCTYLQNHTLPRKIEIIAREARLSEDIFFLNLDFRCQELIGIRKKEELIY